jgi:hypothetical protein
VLSFAALAQYFPREVSGRANAALGVLNMGTAFALQSGRLTASHALPRAVASPMNVRKGDMRPIVRTNPRSRRGAELSRQPKCPNRSCAILQARVWHRLDPTGSAIPDDGA